MANQLDKVEQVTPLAPASHRSFTAVEHAHVSFSQDHSPKFPSRKCIKLCGCLSAISLVIVTIVLILMLTVFHIKNPVLEINSVRIEGANTLSNNTASFSPRVNLTLLADISVKNPNAASFKFRNATTTVYYDGSVVGETRTPEGRAPARRTVSMSLTAVDIMADRIVRVPRFGSDLASGLLPISTYTRLDGKVKITDVIKRSFVVRMNCTMNFDLLSQAVQDQRCRSRVSL